MNRILTYFLKDNIVNLNSKVIYVIISLGRDILTINSKPGEDSDGCCASDQAPA